MLECLLLIFIYTIGKFIVICKPRILGIVTSDWLQRV